MAKSLYIINPASHGGKGTKTWEKFLFLYKKNIDSKDVIFTKKSGHAKEIAVSAQDYETIVAVGGDGTVWEILSGIMEQPEPRPRLGIIPVGTGNDIARHAGILSVEDSVAALRKQQTKSYDLIKIQCERNGNTVQTYAFLFANIGFNINAMVKPWMKRLLTPKGAYYLGTILASIIHQSKHTTIEWESGKHSDRVWSVIIANSEYAGGNSMRIAPGAELNDGLLNLSIIPSKSKLTMLVTMLPKVAKGTHINEQGVLYFTAKDIRIESEPPSVIEIDGDIFGMTPATFVVCPGALEILSL